MPKCSNTKSLLDIQTNLIPTPTGGASIDLARSQNIPLTAFFGASAVLSVQDEYHRMNKPKSANGIDLSR